MFLVLPALLAHAFEELNRLRVLLQRNIGFLDFRGAAALGDIGQHFPDTDPKYKGISSIALLKEVGALLEAEGYVIENIDATIIAQRPKLAVYRPQMAENIAHALKLPVNRVSVKATTEAFALLPEDAVFR